MDKETLSNYGWIVVLILVLSVLLALATPFGRFVADGFEATYEGFDNTSNKAFSVLGLSENDGGTGENGGTQTPINALKFSDEGSYVMLYGENDVKKRPINFYFNEDGTLSIGKGPSMYVLGINDADRMGNQGNWEVFNFGMTVAEAVEDEYGITYADMFAEGSRHLIDDTHILCYLGSGYGDGDETTYTYDEETGKVSASLDYIGSGITDFVITETEAYLIINGKKEYVEFVPDGEDFCGETFKGNTFPSYGKPDGFDVAVVDNGNTYQIMTFANVEKTFVAQDIMIYTFGTNITSCNKPYIDNGDGTITFEKETLIDTEIITIVTDNGTNIGCLGFSPENGTALLSMSSN